MCECEHKDHFPEAPEGLSLDGKDATEGNTPKHPYGEDVLAGVTVKTPFGHFTVCQDCSNTCYKQYPVIAGIQK